MKTALITGASNGIGYEIAKLFAKDKINLVLVARNESKLLSIKKYFEQNYNISVKIIIKDLSLNTSPYEIFDELNKENISIEYLVNNAGFGYWGKFSDTNLEKELQMINLNIISLTILTKLFLTNMIKNNFGRILNIASTASFQPGPNMAIYYATKAYVLSFSEAISEELRGSSVSITTLCPGPTNTNFENFSGLNKAKLFKIMKPANAYKVAMYGYKAMMKRKRLAIYGFTNKIILIIEKFFPRILILKVIKYLQS